MEVLVLVVYGFCLLFLFLFSLGQLHLLWYYLKGRKSGSSLDLPVDLAYVPKVCIQLPLYNEKYVVERLLEAVFKMDYPSEYFEIQVLDDSSDETSQIIDQKVQELDPQQKVFQVIRRKDRKGFKAGALQLGLEKTEAEFIAIFDADFLPGSDFVKKTLGYFAHPKVGMVQSRWGHLNQNFNLLTRLQAFGLDAHFSIEQVGRGKAGSFINFNGTGGIWRKQCIIDAGGWSADTLTEDLDLSYRAQMRGWKFQYLEHLESPAELPMLMPAIKSQQYRWNKGAAETAKKHLRQVLRSKVGWKNKLHAFFHLLNSSVFLFLLIAALLTLPVLWLKESHPQWQGFFNLASVFLLGFLSIALFYWYGSSANSWKKFFGYFPMFMCVSMGLSLHNAIAVSEGYLGRKSAFVRTPKFGLNAPSRAWKKNSYFKGGFTWTLAMEGLLSAYFLAGIVLAIYWQSYALLLFQFMLFLGFLTVFFHSLRHQPNGK